MKIKTLQDLSDNFEVLSRSEEKETLGGVDLISTTDGYIYDVNIENLGYVVSSFIDSDPWTTGGSFSYVVDGGYGSSVTINVNEGDWGPGVVGPPRFTLAFVDPYFESSASGYRVYYDNVTGESFMANYTRPVLGGYNYENLPDIVISDNDMGNFSGYTKFEVHLEKYMLFDDLTGGYNDYSRFISVATHYDADYAGMVADGYAQQAINAQIARDNASRASGNFIASLMNHLNGSKLAAAQKAWAADPNHYGQQFDYGTYSQSNLPTSTPAPPTPMIHIEDSFGNGSRAIKDYFEWFKNEVEANGLQNVYSYIFNP